MYKKHEYGIESECGQYVLENLEECLEELNDRLKANKEIALKTDNQLLMLMKSVHAFLNGHIPLQKLEEAQEQAEIYRSFSPAISN
jgi:hypothetical protein